MPSTKGKPFSRAGGGKTMKTDNGVFGDVLKNVKSKKIASQKNKPLVDRLMTFVSYLLEEEIHQKSSPKVGRKNK